MHSLGNCLENVCTFPFCCVTFLSFCCFLFLHSFCPVPFLFTGTNNAHGPCTLSMYLYIFFISEWLLVQLHTVFFCDAHIHIRTIQRFIKRTVYSPFLFQQPLQTWRSSILSSDHSTYNLLTIIERKKTLIMRSGYGCENKKYR